MVKILEHPENQKPAMMDIHDKDLSRENTRLLGLIGRISGEATVAGSTVCRDLPSWIR